MGKVRCFVAYPSMPPSLVESVEKAVQEINNGQVVEITTWRNLTTNGNLIIERICTAINDSQIFICDLTGLNHNVLFELGYALARKKKLHILLDKSIEKNRTDFERISLFSTIGYSAYSSSRDIIDEFYKQKPYENIEETVFKETFSSVITKKSTNKLFHIKSSHNTDASIMLARKIASCNMASSVDDPSEVPFQPLAWYAQQLIDSYAVVTHFVGDNMLESNLHNAKAAFVSGLAFGLDKSLLMLAHSPFSSPIDYKDLLKTHDTASKCEIFVQPWLNKVVEEYHSLKNEKQGHLIEAKQQEELKNIRIGEYVAEQEPDELIDYFVETAAYNEALRVKGSIFIGRKGTGKTANLIKLRDTLREDKRKHVCVITPVGYEIEGIIRMLKQTIPKSEKGYLIESLWKFLIYAELVKSCYESINSRPIYFTQTESEKELCTFVNEHKEIILSEFSIKLERVVGELQNIPTSVTSEEQRLKISELLHDKIIVGIRRLLGGVLNAKSKVVILIDNLDKAWNAGSDYNVLCEMLFGLLEVSQRITLDFQSADIYKEKVNLSLLIFLRNDIFNEIIKYAPEKDKIQVSRIVWDDQEVLIRVLEERFMVSCPSIEYPKQIWDQYFCAATKNIPTRDYIISIILPRPRDLLYFARSAIANAVNHRHSRIEEDDILRAEKEYSQYAINTIIVESTSRCDNLEELIYEFIQEDEIVDISVVENALKNCKIPLEKVEDTIELLFDLSFLGIETSNDKFEFLTNEESKFKLRKMEQKLLERHPDKTRLFKINKPFHSFLEIH